MVFKLFKDYPDYVSQISIPIERRLKLLFLEVRHMMNVSSIMRSLTRNYTASYRDPETMLQKCKDVLPPHLLARLKRVLNHHSPTKFIGHIISEQYRQACAYGNHV